MRIVLPVRGWPLPRPNVSRSAARSSLPKLCIAGERLLPEREWRRSSPLHLTLRDLGADVERNTHADAGIAFAHGRGELGAILGSREFFLEDCQVFPGVGNRGGVRSGAL